MAGLIGLGQAYRQQGDQMLATASGLETRRNEEKRMAQSARTNNMISGATSGAIVGNMIAPGVGIPVGAAIGILAGSIF